jgi:hypothetical protein
LRSFYSCFGKNSSDPQICSGNGICNGTDQCSCETNYFGNQCQQTYCFGVLSTQNNVCSQNGICKEFDTCTCSPNFGGKNCEIYLEPTNIAYSFGLNSV